MKKNIFYLTLIAVFFAACSQIDPVQYNDKVVEYSDNADNQIEAFYSKLTEAFDNDDLSTISAIGKTAIDSIQMNLDLTNKLEKPSGSDAFHAASVAYLESLISCVKIATDEYGKITEDTSDAELDSIDALVENATNESYVKFDEMIKTQEEFAKTSNFELIQNKK